MTKNCNLKNSRNDIKTVLQKIMEQKVMFY